MSAFMSCSCQPTWSYKLHTKAFQFCTDLWHMIRDELLTCSSPSGWDFPTPMSPAAHWLSWSGTTLSHRSVSRSLITWSAKRRWRNAATTPKWRQVGQDLPFDLSVRWKQCFINFKIFTFGYILVFKHPGWTRSPSVKMVFAFSCQ